MAINLTDELVAKTAKGKIASARQVYLEGDEVNLQQVAEKTNQLEATVKNITITGGASSADVVSYNNESSGLTSVNVQGAVDELVTKNSQLSKSLTELSNKAVSNEDVEYKLDQKVDKEVGKSLIGDDIAECFQVVETNDYIYAIADADSRILFGIDRETGKPDFPLNDMYHVDKNEDYLAVWLDENDKIILGIKTDGTIDGHFSNIEELTKMVATLKADIDDLKSDGSFEVSSFFSTIEDDDNRLEITQDEQGRILGYRDHDGIRHEEKMQVNDLSVSNLSLETNALSSLATALKAQGFSASSPMDWSDRSFIQFPEPRLAMINVSGIDAMPETKKDNLHAYLEFWDHQGNYFRKKCILNAQGNSSMEFPKKNIAVDFCDDDWIGESKPRIRVGNWVPQDSFHLKAYYTDFFRGIGAVCYKLYDEIVRQRGVLKDRPWKRAMIDEGQIGLGSSSFDFAFNGDTSLAVEDAARCVPDGFPAACYLNGEFYGIFSFQLKKHYDNYRLDPTNYKHVHLDGSLDESNFWAGTINWSVITVRNPKNLYGIDGTPYDPDVKKQELAGETELNAWKDAGCLPDGTVFSFRIRRMVEATVKVKTIIQNLVDGMKVMHQERDMSNNPHAHLITNFVKYFVIENLVDYITFSDFVQNIDGFGLNWQWFTYDGVKWYVAPYDCDSTFGADFQGRTIAPPASKSLAYPEFPVNPAQYMMVYNSMIGKTTFKTFYDQLCDNGILTAEHAFSLVRDWMDRIGPSFYQLEFEKWKDSPCINASEVNTEYWDLVLAENGSPVLTTIQANQDKGYTLFDFNKKYSVGDVVTYEYAKRYKYTDCSAWYYKFKCIKEISEPKTDGTTTPLASIGHMDSIYRIYRWIEFRFNKPGYPYILPTLES